MENENMYRKMVVIFVDLLGTKNNKRFEDKLLIHRLFHEEVKTNERRNMGHVIYDMFVNMGRQILFADNSAGFV